ncbi:defensin 2 [Megachile rotundata]|uniref:defensin 2 n=1 Tax=Megachile rotundata TaxID=143995 RepID=UPI000614F081|nr:PREDICTED: defensin-2-like [Megachile rotundata]
MKLQLIVVSILAMIAYVYGVSVPEAVYDGPTYELKPVEGGEETAVMNPEVSTDMPVRQRRVTCDVLSWQSQWFTVNHSACAIKCLAQRRRGGSCRGGVCVCR